MNQDVEMKTNERSPTKVFLVEVQTQRRRHGDRSNRFRRKIKKQSQSLLVQLGNDELTHGVQTPKRDTSDPSYTVAEAMAQLCSPSHVISTLEAQMKPTR